MILTRLKTLTQFSIKEYCQMTTCHSFLLPSLAFLDIVVFSWLLLAIYPRTYRQTVPHRSARSTTAQNEHAHIGGQERQCADGPILQMRRRYGNRNPSGAFVTTVAPLPVPVSARAHILRLPDRPTEQVQWMLYTIIN